MGLSNATAGTDYIAGNVGTAGTIAKFSASGVLANSSWISENVAGVGFGTSTPIALCDIHKNAGAPLLSLSRYNGSGGSDVSAGDDLGYLAWYAMGSGSPRNAAYINVNVIGTPAADTVAGRMLFATCPAGVSQTPLIRMTIDQNGNVAIGQTTATQKLDVNGNILIESTNNLYLNTTSNYINSDGTLLTVAGASSARIQGGSPTHDSYILINNGVAIDIHPVQYTRFYGGSPESSSESTGLICTIAGDGVATPSGITLTGTSSYVSFNQSTETIYCSAVNNLDIEAKGILRLASTFDSTCHITMQGGSPDLITMVGVRSNDGSTNVTSGILQLVSGEVRTTVGGATEDITVVTGITPLVTATLHFANGIYTGHT